MVLTLRDRQRARDIVHGLRNSYNRTTVAAMLGLKPCYVSTIEHMSVRRYPYPMEQGFHAPVWAVDRVLIYQEVQEKIRLRNNK